MQKLGQLKGFEAPARSRTFRTSTLPVFAEPPLPLSHLSSPCSLSPARPPPPLPPWGVRGQLPGYAAEPVLAEAAVSYLCSLIQADISLPRGPTFASRGTLAAHVRQRVSVCALPACLSRLSRLPTAPLFSQTCLFAPVRLLLLRLP